MWNPHRIIGASGAVFTIVGELDIDIPKLEEEQKGPAYPSFVFRDVIL